MPDMRLIDANALMKSFDIAKMVEYDETGCGVTKIAIPVQTIKDAPTIDAVEVVRCRECKYSVNIFKGYFLGCDMWKQSTPEDGFCHMGEKMYGGAEG